MGKIQDAGQNHGINAANNIFENAENLKYLVGMTRTIRNCVHE
jgi:hypothetical protein